MFTIHGHALDSVCFPPTIRTLAVAVFPHSVKNNCIVKIHNMELSFDKFLTKLSFRLFEDKAENADKWDE